MKIYSLLFALLISFQVFGQQPETTFIKKKIKNSYGSKYKVKYFALESDTTIKHGYYERYNIIRSLEETGYYKYGVKDSTWRTYIIGKYVGSVGNYAEGKKNGTWSYYTNIGTLDPRYDKKSPTVLVKSGNYNNDTIVGIWSYYNYGKLEQQYDHTNDTIIYPIIQSNAYFYTIKTDTGIIKHLLDRPPMLIGGHRAETENWKAMDGTKLSQLSNGQREISYKLTFWIKPNGETYNYEMTEGVNEEYDNYIIEFYKANYKWVPGLLNGKNVECEKTISTGYRVMM